ncbi:guanine nucleotide binding protein, alpha subunit [Glomus cerebriforme]|uniref:Guanine nucleotide binding protein, alpha subunit n=1 Tax=Glomus cerebriforme TaxID=658196 RepID=A0A397T6E3_9GLOM|nr:guanine nucleotide binding protein, alpha subunit [Glomus cerebriforme]
MASVSTNDMSDPLKPFIPSNETSEDKRRRVLAEKEAKKKSEAIDKQIKAEKERISKQKLARLLLLGSSESGKSTVLKQIKIIHGNGLEDERQQYRRIVHLNVLTAMKALTNALTSFGYTLDSSNLIHLEKFSRLNSVKDSLNRNSMSVQAAVRDARLDDNAFQLFMEHSEAIKALWKDPAIIKAYDHASEIGLQDSAKYFLDRVDAFAKADYLPTDEDILQARVRTMGVTEHLFKIDGTTYKIYDVGGHRSQRHFWAPYFDDVNAIIFMAAVSSFDQTLEEAPNVNRMTDAIQLFGSICNHPLFVNTSIILFLNKIDILKRKLEFIQLKDYFPDYEGDNKFQSVTKFFQNTFINCNENDEKHIYVHFTHATDTKQMRVIVASVNDIVQRMNLKASGLI